MQYSNRRSDWLEKMAAAEIECGGIVIGRRGSPDDHPPLDPVEEDEETLRQFFRDNLQEMLDKEAELKAQSTFPNIVPHDTTFMPSGMNYTQR